MRVSYLYDIPLPCRFAAAIQILNTCRELARLGVPTTVYAGPLGGTAEACLAFYGLRPHENLTLRPLFAPGPLGRLGLRRRLASALGEAGPEGGAHLVISRGEAGIAVLPLLRRARLGADARFVYEAHRLCFAHEAERRSGRAWREGDALPWRVERLRRRERAAIERADGVVCLTEGVRDALTRAFRLTRPVLVLPSGAPGPPDADDGPVAGRDIDVLYVGKLEERKGLSVLIEAMRHLPGRRLCVVGGTPAEVETCRGLAHRHGVGDRIEFTGFVEPARVRAYLGRARVGVCPLPAGVSVTSERFTSPLKMLELMACGVPVVASDLPSVREVATHQDSAVLVPPNDADALANGLCAVLDDPELAGRLREAGRRRAAAFSWSERAARLRGFLEALVGGPAQGLRATRG